jgi:hypothetical protein
MPSPTYRVLVSTDLGGDPDDIQSLIHLLHYSDILKEGDTPTFLYLLSPVIDGVGNVDDATAESWGGQFRRPLPQAHPNYFVDLDAPADVCHATINKWRVAYLSDWKARWAWYAENRD